MSLTLPRRLASRASLTAGLWAWWEADNITGLVDNDPVVNWPSRFAERTLTQGTAAKRPLFKTAILNGHPIVRFDGSNDSLVLPSLPNLDDEYTLLALRKATSAIGRGVLGLGIGAGSSPTLGFGSSNFTAVFTHRSPLGGAEVANLNLVVDNDKFLIHEVRRQQGKFQAWYRFNDSVLGWEENRVGQLVTQCAWESGRVGCYFQTGAEFGFFTGDVAALIVYERALSDAEIRHREAYLMGKYLS